MTIMTDNGADNGTDNGTDNGSNTRDHDVTFWFYGVKANISTDIKHVM